MNYLKITNRLNNTVLIYIPIQLILGLAELLRRQGINIDKDKEYLEIIFRNSKRLIQLAEEILDVTRIECGSFFLKDEKSI